MNDLKTPQRLAAAVVVTAAVMLLVLAIVLWPRSARGAALPTCANYLTVARDLHQLRLWYLDGQPGGAEFDKAFLAWMNVSADDLVVTLAYGKPTLGKLPDARGWELLWVNRYRDCLTELGGR